MRVTEIGATPDLLYYQASIIFQKNSVRRPNLDCRRPRLKQLVRGPAGETVLVLTAVPI
jgi:hypothetical protein